MSSLTRYGNTELVTGASSGIGKSYARAIAKEGLNLILVACRKPLLEELAAELSRDFGVQVHTLAQDLSDVNVADQVFDQVQQLGLEVDILINNAGYGSHGEFEQLDLVNELNMINLSCHLPLALTHKFIGGMKQRNRGAVIFSPALLAPCPYPICPPTPPPKPFRYFLPRASTVNSRLAQWIFLRLPLATPAPNLETALTFTTACPPPRERQTM